MDDEKLKLIFPLNQRINIKGYDFAFVKKYSKKYKLKCLDRTKTDFTNHEFSIGKKHFKIIQRKDLTNYICREIYE